MTDLDALTLTLWGEARGEPIESLIGVAMVVANRARDHYRGARSVSEVCLAPAQFSCWIAAGGELDAMHRAEATLSRGGLLPPDLDRCFQVARATLAGTLADNTQHANHYHEQSVHPDWAQGLTPLVQLGHHLFYSCA